MPEVTRTEFINAIIVNCLKLLETQNAGIIKIYHIKFFDPYKGYYKETTLFR